MEVNLSPSMGTESSLDKHIKSNLILDTLNIISMKNFNRRKENIKKVRNRLRVRPGRETFGSPDFTRRGEFYNAGSNRNYDIFKETFEEYSRRGNYIRIYPAYGTDIYNKYFTSQRALNKDLYDMLFGKASAFQKQEK